MQMKLYNGLARMCNAIWIGSSLFDDYRSHSGSADVCVLFQEPEYTDLSGFDGNLIKNSHNSCRIGHE